MIGLDRRHHLRWLGKNGSHRAPRRQSLHQPPSLGNQPMHAVFIRAPMVTSVGDAAEVLATDPDGRPVAVRQGRVLATSFHPELTGDRRMHRLLLTMVEEDARRPA